jgi:hypothetical protein
MIFGEVNFEAFQADLKIFISLVQVLGALGTTYSIPFPPIYSSVLRWLSVLELNIFELMPLACQGVDFNFYSSLQIKTLIPIIILLIGIFWNCICRCTAYLKGMGDRLIGIWFWLIFLVYPSTSQMVFNTFNCREFDDPGASSALIIDYTIDCNADAHTTMSMYAGIMLILYPFGIPLLYGWLLFFRYGGELKLLRSNEDTRRKVRAEALASIYLDRRLRSKEIYEKDGLRSFVIMPTDADLPDSTKKMIKQLEREHTAILSKMPEYVQKLATGFRTTVFWFEIFECIRKLFLVCIPVFFEPGSSTQLIFGLMICFITFGAYTALTPFVADTSNTFSQLCQMQIFFACSRRLHSTSPTTRTRTEGTYSTSRWLSACFFQSPLRWSSVPRSRA